MSLILSFRRRNSSVRLRTHCTKTIYCYTLNTRVWIHEYKHPTTELHPSHMLAVQPTTEQ